MDSENQSLPPLNRDAALLFFGSFMSTIPTRTNPSLPESEEERESGNLNNSGDARIDCGVHDPLTSADPLHILRLPHEPGNPLLEPPLAPFSKSNRKKAYTSAIYYSECFRHGIPQQEAERAASNVQGHYTKWWVNAIYKSEKSGKAGRKRSRLQRRASSESDRETSSSQDKNGNLDTIDHIKYIKQRSDVSSASETCSRRAAESSSDPGKATTNYSKQCTKHGKGDEQGEDHEFSDTRHKSSEMNSSNISRLVSCRSDVDATKAQLLSALKQNQGDSTAPAFQDALHRLNALYKASGYDARYSSQGEDASQGIFDLDGTWLTLTKPNFSDCAGFNSEGQCLYTLGRIAFDMFRPTDLMCSVQGIFNTIHHFEDSESDSQGKSTTTAASKSAGFLPRKVKKQVHRQGQNSSLAQLKTYNIVVAFTIEPKDGQDSSGDDVNIKPEVNRPIRGIMTSFGYILPHPVKSNRLSIWFTGGTLEVNDEENDLEEWKRIFTAPSSENEISERAHVVAARALLGAHVPDKVEEDGTMHYYLSKPIGGHDAAYCDILFLDESVRVVRGHHGSLYVFSRIVNPLDQSSQTMG